MIGTVVGRRKIEDLPTPKPVRSYRAAGMNAPEEYESRRHSLPEQPLRSMYPFTGLSNKSRQIRRPADNSACTYTRSQPSTR